MFDHMARQSKRPGRICKFADSSDDRYKRKDGTATYGAGFWEVHVRFETPFMVSRVHV